MQTFKNKKDGLQIDFDTTELGEHQVRVIKTINTLLTQLQTTAEESEFFETTNELMRTLACAVKHSRFSKENSAHIKYAEQALEFAVDELADQINEAKYLRYDN